MFEPRPKPVTLVVLDGWGIAAPSRGNAISQAVTPVFHKLVATYPTMALQAAGEAVGLPWGEMGNSEVGHLTLGSGKIIYQPLPRINRAIIDGSFFQNETLLQSCRVAAKDGKTLHLIGLVSSGGVHSSIDHLYALLELAKNEHVPRTVVHAILDGRDTPYDSGKKFMSELEAKMKKLKYGKVASLMGRFYAMDRDSHWDRVQAAYNCMALGLGKPAVSVTKAIAASYQAKVYDEELLPTYIEQDGKALATIGEGDAIILFNFRPDRMRQITHALSLPSFVKFERKTVQELSIVTMAEYDKDLPVSVAFPREEVSYPLARVLSEAGLAQLHLAETEKYAHVTYFFNGGHEQPYAGEEHVLVPSPVVPSYDQKPEMSARGITDRYLQAVRTGKYDFVVINYANPDMVAHTGNLPATVKAIEVIDECLGEVVAATLEYGGAMLITADHGNAEALVNPQTGEIDKEHSNVPVPLIMVARELENKAVSGVPVTDDMALLTPSGVLADVAPTILAILGLPKHPDMTGQSLL